MGFPPGSTWSRCVSIRRISAGKRPAVQKDLYVPEPSREFFAPALMRGRLSPSALALTEVKRQLLGTSEEELCLALAGTPEQDAMTRGGQASGLNAPAMTEGKSMHEKSQSGREADRSSGRKMRLFSAALSMFGAKVQIAAHEKGIDFELVMVTFTQKEGYAPKHPEVLRINPKRQVPVLIDGDLEIFDSTQI